MLCSVGAFVVLVGFVGFIGVMWSLHSKHGTDAPVWSPFIPGHSKSDASNCLATASWRLRTWAALSLDKEDSEEEVGGLEIDESDDDT